MSFNKAKVLETASRYVQQGKYREAVEEYRRIIQADPSDITTLNTLGDLCSKIGDHEEAIRSFLRIASHYRADGLNLKAIAMLKKVNKLDPANVKTALELAELYSRQKLIVEARQQYLSVAEHYLRTGQHKQALNIYQQLFNLEPEDTTIQFRLAEAYLRDQQIDQAYGAFVAGADELQRQGKYEEALQAYLRALDTKPDGQLALSAVVNIYTLRNEPQRAVAMIEPLVEARPDDAELLVLLGRVHRAANNLSAAEEVLIRAVKLDPARYQYLLDLASFFVRGGDSDGALRLLDLMLETLHERREEELCIALLHEVLARDANHFGALKRLATIYARIRKDHSLIETLGLLADVSIRKGEDGVAINTMRQLLQEEIESINFYISEGMLDVAQEKLQSLLYLAVNTIIHKHTQELSDQARRDTLTSLPNRTSFEESLGAEFDRAHRYNREMSIVLLDIDGFTLINDRFGHQAGDQVLINIARILQSSLRRSDAAFRHGSDEFVLICPETPGGMMRGVMWRIEASVRAYRQGARLLEEIGISWGVASFPADATDAEELIRIAKERLAVCQEEHQRWAAERAMAADSDSGSGTTGAAGQDTHIAAGPSFCFRFNEDDRVSVTVPGLPLDEHLLGQEVSGAAESPTELDLTAEVTATCAASIPPSELAQEFGASQADLAEGVVGSEPAQTGETEASYKPTPRQSRGRRSKELQEQHEPSTVNAE